MAESLSYPPPYMDKVTLAKHLSISVETVESWVLRRIIPPGQLKGGKLMWKWLEVERWMDSNPRENETRSMEDAVREERKSRARAAGH